MRLSTDENDPGYIAFEEAQCAGRKIDVFLDGNEIEDVETVDDEEGIVVRFARHDDDGTLKLDETLENIERETLRGEVRIVLGEPVPTWGEVKVP